MKNNPNTACGYVGATQVLLVVEGVVGELQKAGDHDEAVLTLRLLVRRDQVCFASTV